VTDDEVIEAVATVFERNLGRLHERHHVSDRLHVLRFDNLESKMVTYVSLGLSRLELTQEAGPIRQEILVDCHRRFSNEHWVAVVSSVAGRVAIDERALAAFEIVPLDPTLARLTGTPALLCYTPIHHGEAVHVITATRPPTVIVGLVPLRASEVAFASEHGWEELIAAIEDRQPDLLDMKRRPVA
jgi:hypothetical protein